MKIFQRLPNSHKVLQLKKNKSTFIQSIIKEKIRLAKEISKTAGTKRFSGDWIRPKMKSSLNY